MSDLLRLSRTRSFQTLFVGVLALSVLAGCGGPYIHSSVQHRTIGLLPDGLQDYGIAFITPSSITGREEDRQSLALTFAEVLRAKRPDIRVVTLAETLGAVNRAELTSDYKAMFEEYRDTGIFKQDILKKIGEVTGTRYIAQLKLAGFNQEVSGRLGMLGIRILETKRANLRVFFQIWDSQEGTVVWEGTEEMNYADDTASEKAITFRVIAEATANNLITHIPYHAIDDSELP